MITRRATVPACGTTSARRVTGKDFGVKFAGRRPGDPASLIADASKARRILGWQPVYTDIEAIVRDAWGYEQRRKPGTPG